VAIIKDHHIQKLYSLNNEVVVISGGAGFLGKEFAIAACESGAQCALIDANMEMLEETRNELNNQGYQVSIWHVNITDTFELDKVISRIIKEHGKIDVLINSAALAMKDMQQGGSSYFDPVESYGKDLWQNALDINLTGTFMMCQRVGNHMKSKQKGSIINIASDVAIISPDHRIYEPNELTGYEGSAFNTPLSYCVSKTGILGMTRYLSTYWAKDGIRVNSISPAGVYRKQPPNFVKELTSRIPMGRMANVHELKGPAIFLASEASSFVTGSNLVVDGGRTIW
jgi:NAD(P)-dependent dehydrogenase (short-subunit alcohol dehydrogenase family)